MCFIGIVGNGKCAAAEFRWFDYLSHTGKPTLTSLGFEPIALVGGRMWLESEDPAELPNRYMVRKMARDAAKRASTVVIDIEHWPIRGDESSVANSIRMYREVLRWYKDVAPDATVGLYSVIPIRDYWRSIRQSDDPERRAWQVENTRLAAIADDVDALFPSLYTFYEDRQGWLTYAQANIAEARRLANGKPVYAFLTPYYEGSEESLRGLLIPEDFWYLQLQTVRKHADGVVLWGGWKRQWDQDAGWWRATETVVEEMQSNTGGTVD